jgi:hypothetical protein
MRKTWHDRGHGTSLAPSDDRAIASARRRAIGGTSEGA